MHNSVVRDNDTAVSLIFDGGNQLGSLFVSPCMFDQLPHVVDTV